MSEATKTITVRGEAVELSRPLLRRAVDVASALAHFAPEPSDGNESDEGEIGPEFGTITAAALGLCLPRACGGPKPPRGYPGPEGWLAYGDMVDRWVWQTEAIKPDDWLPACDAAMSVIHAAIPTADRAEAAAVPTEAHGAQPSGS